MRRDPLCYRPFKRNRRAELAPCDRPVSHLNCQSDPIIPIARAPASSRLSAINLAHHLYGIADERRTHKMEIEALKMQLRDSQEKTELAVARGEGPRLSNHYY